MNDRRDDPVTERQEKLLRKLGLLVPATKGEASDLLTAHFEQTDGDRDKPTPKQAAKLEYMGIAVPKTKDEARDLLDEIENDPTYEEKRIDWDLDKYDLHPDLYFETDEEMWTRIRQQRERADTKKYIQRILRSSNQKNKNPQQAKKSSVTSKDLLLVCALVIVPMIFTGALFGNTICIGLSVLIVVWTISHFWRKKKAGKTVI